MSTRAEINRHLSDARFNRNDAIADLDRLIAAATELRKMVSTDAAAEERDTARKNAAYSPNPEAAIGETAAADECAAFDAVDIMRLANRIAAKLGEASEASASAADKARNIPTVND